VEFALQSPSLPGARTGGETRSLRWGVLRQREGGGADQAAAGVACGYTQAVCAVRMGGSHNAGATVREPPATRIINHVGLRCV
jgi:hypothetical protein